MKKRLFAMVASFLLVSALTPISVFASSDLTTSSEYAVNSFVLNYDSTAVVDQLASGKVEPVLQDEVSFSLSGPVNAGARIQNENSVCDVRRIGTVDDIDIYQATYIVDVADATLQDTTERYIDGMRVSFLALYSVRQYNGENYNRFINSRIRVLSSSDDHYIDEYQLNFMALGYGFADQDSTDNILVSYNNPSAVGGPVYVGDGFVRHNTHTEYVAESHIEGTCASAPFVTSLGSFFELEVCLGLDEL